MIAQVKREGRSFWSGQARSSKLSLTSGGGNVNYYKSVHHPIPILPVETGNKLAIFKTNQ